MSLKWADLVTQREDGRHSDEGLAAVTVVAIAKKKKKGTKELQRATKAASTVGRDKDKTL